MLTSTRNKIFVAVGILIVVIIGAVLFSLGRTTSETIVDEPTASTATSVETVISHSVEGRDITATTFGTGDTHLLFVGGIHGGYEWNSVLVAYNLIDYLDGHLEDVPENLSITIVPNANPDAVFDVTGKEGRFTIDDVSTSADTLKSARFNADKVDLNRNFACNWQPTGTWQSKTVSAGTEAFSEPETQAIRDLVQNLHPVATVFWHSASGAVYASHCGDTAISVAGRTLMNTYAKASGYPAVDTFDSYPVNGAADDWMSTINLPAVTVELSSHDSVEWEKNLAGIKAVIEHYSYDEGSRP
jgi:predicted deacylase